MSHFKNLALENRKWRIHIQRVYCVIWGVGIARIIWTFLNLYLFFKADYDNINGPCLIKVPEWISNPIGRYYIYFGHHKGQVKKLSCDSRIPDCIRRYSRILNNIFKKIKLAYSIWIIQIQFWVPFNFTNQMFSILKIRIFW